MVVLIQLLDYLCNNITNGRIHAARSSSARLPPARRRPGISSRNALPLLFYITWAHSRGSARLPPPAEPAQSPAQIGGTPAPARATFIRRAAHRAPYCDSVWRDDEIYSSNRDDDDDDDRFCYDDNYHPPFGAWRRTRKDHPKPPLPLLLLLLLLLLLW